MYNLAVESTLPTVQYGLLTHAFPLHEHRQWEIHVFTAGQGSLVQDGETWLVGPGSLTLSPPGRPHELFVDKVLSFYYLQFDADREVSGVLRRLADAQGQRGPLKVEASTVTEVGRLKDRLDSSVADRVASGVHGFRAWLYDLAVGGAEVEADGIDRVLTWLRENLDRPLVLADLAAVADLDPFALCRKFKARTGLSPLAYVHRSKVEAAGFLLVGTNLTLAEVAQRLGFCDEFHFGKVFKKWRGTPPGRWRRLHQ